MANLEDPFSLFSYVDQLVGFIYSGSHRFFHHYIYALFKTVQPYLAMKGGWHYDAGRIYLGKEIMIVGKCLGIVGAGDFLCGWLKGVDDSDQLNIVHRCVFLGMEFTQISGSDNPDPDF